jgi:Putative auto-transporter adhesin, head GIN domain
MKNLLLLVLLLPVLSAGCHHGFGAGVKGSGKRVTQKRDVGSFTSISAEGAFDIEIVCQKTLGIEVEADDNLLPLISTEVSNNVLRLKPTSNYSTPDAPKIKINVPNIEAFSADGAGKIDISGVSNDKLQIALNGAPNLTASGTTKMIGIDTNGAARIDTHNLRAAHAVVDSKGVSKVDLGVSNQLDVTVSGPSHVTYSGDPVVNKTVHGPGKVEKRNDEGA